MTAVCWGPCAHVREPYLLIPAPTYLIRYFRCDECGVEWQDTYSLTPHIIGQLVFSPLAESIAKCLPVL